MCICVLVCVCVYVCNNLFSAGLPVYRALVQLWVLPACCVDCIDVDDWHLLVQNLKRTVMIKICQIVHFLLAVYDLPYLGSTLHQLPNLPVQTGALQKQSLLQLSVDFSITESVDKKSLHRCRLPPAVACRRRPC